MQKLLLGIVPALLMASGLVATPAKAEQPFIKAEFYKKNISLKQFRENPRSYFRSEAAFDLIVDYVGDEIGQKLSDAEFIALVRSDRVTVRDCPVTERIHTGAYANGQFDWFYRMCRQDEQILQVEDEDGRLIDVLSLNCLNAKEDETPVPLALKKRVQAQPIIQYVAQPSQSIPQKTVIQTQGIWIPGSTFTVGCVCCGQLQTFGTSSTFVPGSTITSVDFGF